MQDELPRSVQISMDMFPDEKRLAMWREADGRGVAKVDIEPISDDPFHADVTFNFLPNVAIASASRSAAHDRVTRELLKDFSDIIAVSILRSGEASATQLGHELIGGVGSASMLSGADASVSTLNTDGSFITLALSRPAIAELAPDYAAAFGRPIPADDPALRLLTKYLDAVLAADELNHPEVARSVSAHILDLVALALGARGGQGEAALGGAKAARLKALKSDVMSMLGNSDLSSEMIAGRHGISSRYVRKLFEQEGISFTSFVLGERLSRVRRMLRDSRHAHLTIAQLAHACGFNDISYFNRAFRRHFGATPTDVRGERPDDMTDAIAPRSP
ncbi:MAG TPA: AraC family transcriptional regulator [Bradyrhizobium sp.]|nr:AraC family transcriptional regulator [Bradyrhizobium sp.]